MGKTRREDREDCRNCRWRDVRISPANLTIEIGTRIDPRDLGRVYFGTHVQAEQLTHEDDSLDSVYCLGVPPLAEVELDSIIYSLIACSPFEWLNFIWNKRASNDEYL